MTNDEIWRALSRASHHILSVAEPEPDSDAAWNAIAIEHIGAPLLTHQEVAINQLDALAARLTSEGTDAALEACAGVQALRFLVEAGQAQGAWWLIRRVMDGIFIGIGPASNEQST